MHTLLGDLLCSMYKFSSNCGCLKVAFGHMLLVSKSHVLAHMQIPNFIWPLDYKTFYISTHLSMNF